MGVFAVKDIFGTTGKTWMRAKHYILYFQLFCKFDYFKILKKLKKMGTISACLDGNDGAEQGKNSEGEKEG